MAFYDGWGDAAMGALKSVNMKDFGSILGGVGSLAGAWGTYKNDKTKNAMLNKQFDYEVSKDKYAKDKMEKYQAAIDQAWGSSISPATSASTGIGA